MVNKASFIDYLSTAENELGVIFTMREAGDYFFFYHPNHSHPNHRLSIN